jgi:Ser/Thr protein kinase RdoA (MazF antagonist)
VDGRVRTALTDLPPEVRERLRQELGTNARFSPVKELVNSNHSFLVEAGRERFFVKVLRNRDAVRRARRESEVLRHLTDSGFPCPRWIATWQLGDDLAVLLTGWVDALPLRYLDFAGSLAPQYLPSLGELMAHLHRTLGELPAQLLPESQPNEECMTCPPGMEEAVIQCLGAARGKAMLEWRECAAAWLRQSPSAVLHGDLQDKNLLLDRAGQLWLCDFEAVRRGPAAAELSVDRIYLKRELAPQDRAELQELLLKGYGAPGLLEGNGGTLLALLRLSGLMLWRYRQDPLARPVFVEFQSAFERIMRELEN